MAMDGKVCLIWGAHKSLEEFCPDWLRLYGLGWIDLSTRADNYNLSIKSHMERQLQHKQKLSCNHCTAYIFTVLNNERNILQ